MLNVETNGRPYALAVNALNVFDCVFAADLRGGAQRLVSGQWWSFAGRSSLYHAPPPLMVRSSCSGPYKK